MSGVPTVVGAGPAGLAASLTLARAGERVRVLERRPSVGHRFAGDFQGLENWSGPVDAMERLGGLGIRADFAHRPFREVTFYDSRLRAVTARSPRPFFYLLRRGSEEGSLDRALLAQAREAGAEVGLGKAAERAGRGTVVATGPRFGDGLAVGYLFPTDLPDQARCIVSEALAPAGYAYLLVWNRRATLATCLFRHRQRWQEALDRTVAAFRQVVPALDLGNARRFSGFGNVFGDLRLTDPGGRLYVGEAGGLQDPEWGFGLFYALESGVLAARSLLEGFDYDRAARRRFEEPRRAALANRLLFEALPQGGRDRLLRAVASRPGLCERMGRHWAPTPLKGVAARPGLMALSSRLHYRDRACPSPTCDCLWCGCGEGCGEAA